MTKCTMANCDREAKEGFNYCGRTYAEHAKLKRRKYVGGISKEEELEVRRLQSIKDLAVDEICSCQKKIHAIYVNALKRAGV